MMMIMVTLISVNSLPAQQSAPPAPLHPNRLRPHPGPVKGGRDAANESVMTLSTGLHDSVAERSDDDDYNNPAQVTH